MLDGGSGTSRLEPGAIVGIVVGAAVMYVTGLLVAA
jgi:hypothetical protein